MSTAPASYSVDSIFTPVTLGGVRIKNRFAMAPMTRNFSPDGIPGPDVAEYYARRARHGVGLVITEGTVIDHPGSTHSPCVPHFYGDKALAGWAEVVGRVHAEDGKIFAQLWHVGLDPLAGEALGPGTSLIGPSGLVAPGQQITEPMTQRQIDDVVAAFATAAAEAERLGFDGVELHGGHGYLIDQFFWEATNQRTDAYGGDVAARTRFAVEIIEAVRARVSADFPVVLRFSQWKTADFTVKLAADPQELEAFLAPLTDAGVTAFHCSTRRFWTPEFEGSDLTLAGWTKKMTGKPVITVGSVGLDSDYVTMFAEGTGAGTEGIGGVLDRLERGEFDIVAVGRALLGDAEWVAKVRDGRTDELASFSPQSLATLA
ncbi:NADH:flavin oxidoreductase [Streptomyces sp. NBC_00328]|uniref:NADH:flavin oxidoreductase n=1 Tax=Streptomyces sp. NBC_00328 TaxID=2903646 RepID=UPI002E2BAC62|nr:NADH:flavin oxidoreductase [Streptomyces sp. NBC_00328]